MTLLATRANGRRGTIIPRTLLDQVLGASASHPWASDIGIFNNEDGYHVEIPVAGFKPEEIEVTLEDDVLSVSARNERRQISRLLVIPEHIDSNNLDLSVELGMLTITMKANPKSQPKKLNVRSG